MTGPFRAKPDLILQFLRRKGYTGTVYDSLNKYFQDLTGGSTKLGLDDMISRYLNTLGFTGELSDQVSAFFYAVTLKKHPGDAERAFWSDTTNEFYIQRQVAGQSKSCNVTNTGGQQIMVRSRHISRSTITNLKLAYPNWYLDNTTFLETGPGATSTITAAIEYPINTTCTQVTWNGSTSHTIANNDMGPLSDKITVSIPADTPFMVRTYFTNPIGFVADNRSNVVDNSQSFRFANSGLSDQTMTPGAPTGGSSSPNFMYKPLLIVAKTTTPSVLILGDSRQEGNASGEGYTGTSDDIGQIARSIGPYFGYCNLGKGSDSATRFLASSVNRMKLARYYSCVVCAYGVNDISVHSLTAAQAFAVLQNLRSAFPGNVFYQCTITPKNSSTDFFTTLGNLTPTTIESSRISQLNDLIRAGGLGNGFFEVADVVETARNSMFWKTGSEGRVVTDAAGTSADPTITSATANFSSNDTGKILVCTALGHTSALARTMTQVDPTTVTMSGNSTATLSNQTASIDAMRYTRDGVHETTEMNLLIQSSNAIDHTVITQA